VNPVLNGPNALTMLRVLLVPVFCYALSIESYRLIALAVFLAAAITDFFDGWWARREGLVTNFGKIADPIADKAITGAAWIGLSLLGAIPWWATMAILVREIGITIARLLIVERKVIAASNAGKWKTTLQIVVISCYLMFPLDVTGVTASGLTMLLIATVIVTLWTGLAYVRVLLPGRAA